MFQLHEVLLGGIWGSAGLGCTTMFMDLPLAWLATLDCKPPLRLSLDPQGFLLRARFRILRAEILISLVLELHLNTKLAFRLFDDRQRMMNMEAEGKYNIVQRRHFTRWITSQHMINQPLIDCWTEDVSDKITKRMNNRDSGASNSIVSYAHTSENHRRGCLLLYYWGFENKGYSCVNDKKREENFSIPHVFQLLSEHLIIYYNIYKLMNSLHTYRFHFTILSVSIT